MFYSSPCGWPEIPSCFVVVAWKEQGKLNFENFNILQMKNFNDEQISSSLYWNIRSKKRCRTANVWHFINKISSDWQKENWFDRLILFISFVFYSVRRWFWKEGRNIPVKSVPVLLCRKKIMWVILSNNKMFIILSLIHVMNLILQTCS